MCKFLARLIYRKIILFFVRHGSQDTIELFTHQNLIRSQNDPVVRKKLETSIAPYFRSIINSPS